ncbi:MAG: hypothetical protein QNK37_29200 [Acidobacteriota bacterium]|nr:hypothetical protein [Acidobacteriota bacterium]
MGPEDITLALANGKYIEVIGPYKVNAGFVEFRMQYGAKVEYTKLKLEQINLAKTKELNPGFMDPNWKPQTRVAEKDTNRAEPVFEKKRGKLETATPEDVILALKDGQYVHSKGSYAIYGDTIQIVTSSGDLVDLPLEKVDMEKTKELNPGFRDTREDPNIRAKRPKKNRTGGNSVGELLFPELPEDAPPELRETVEKIDDLLQTVNKAPQWLAWVFIGFWLMCLLCSLVSLVTNLVLIFQAFRMDVFWGLGLSFGFFSPLLSVIVSISVSALGMTDLSAVIIWAQLAVSLIYFIMINMYVIKNIYERRILVLLALNSPILCQIGMFVALAIALIMGSAA